MRAYFFLILLLLSIAGCHKDTNTNSKNSSSKSWKKLGTLSDAVVSSYIDKVNNIIYLMTNQGSLYKVSANNTFSNLLVNNTPNQIYQPNNLVSGAMLSLYDSIQWQHIPFLEIRNFNSINSPYISYTQNVSGDTGTFSNLGYQFVDNAKFPGSPIQAFEIVFSANTHNTTTYLYFYTYQLSPLSIAITKRIQLQGANGESFGYAGPPFAYKDKILAGSPSSNKLYVSDTLGNVTLTSISPYPSVINYNDTLLTFDWNSNTFKYSSDGLNWYTYSKFKVSSSFYSNYSILASGLGLYLASSPGNVTDFITGNNLGAMNTDSIGNVNTTQPLIIQSDSTLYLFNYFTNTLLVNSLGNIIQQN